MTFSVTNLGPIEHGSVELADLTVVCGKNNNGKTYLTYALGTFLNTIARNVEVPLSDRQVTALLERGEIDVDLSPYVDQYVDCVREQVPHFKDSLSRFLVMHPDRFVDTRIEVDLAREEVIANMNDEDFVSVESEIRVTDKVSLVFKRERNNPLVARIILVNKSDLMPSRTAIERALAFLLARMIDDTHPNSLFPETFVITCERTGVMLFRQELMKTRKKEGREYPIRANLDDIRSNTLYQRPVEKELEFVLGLGAMQSNKSVIASKHPEIMSMLARISGGEYQFDSETNQVRFIPFGGREKSNSLSLPEASSTVRSIAELYFYLKHKAAPGQLLMFDEPELNLHPANQRLLAQLLAALVNAGVKVFVTTHSDYIIRELNALIRINNIRLHERAQLLRKYGIDKKCLLKDSMVRIYMLGDGRTSSFEFDPDTRSFCVPSFDDTINLFNRLYVDVRDLDAVRRRS